jgi:hypothetical protein
VEVRRIHVEKGTAGRATPTAPRPQWRCVEADHAAVNGDLNQVMNAPDLPRARTAARRFADRWESAYSKAVTWPS